MRKIWLFIKQTWFLSLISIILFGLIIWFIGPLVAIADVKPLASETARLITILVMLLLWGLNNLRISKKSEQKNKTISDEIAENSKPVEVKKTSPDEAILAKRFNAALKTLQTSKLGRKNKFYSLPWYMLIGLPGSGKTTAIKSSGLEFPLKSRFGDNPIEGTGGTRYCDWWFTNEAILLDTAGRYTAQDDAHNNDAKSWLGFLNILKKGRPKRPINGIIVTISVQDLLNKTNTQKNLHSAAIKQRIQEMNHLLGMDLPVYVLITKMDKVAGFSTYFSYMEKEDRSQVFGFNFPYKKQLDEQDFNTHFDKEFNLTLENLNNRVLYLLEHQISQTKRYLIHQFPEQFASLGPTLNEFLKSIFSPNQFEVPPSLRGLYFISSTQENMSSQWLTSQIPTENLTTPVDHISNESKPYFLEKLLKDLIFKEADLASLNKKAYKRYLWTFWSLIGLTCLTFCTTVLLWNQSYKNNDAYIAQVHNEVEDYLNITDGGLADRRSWLSLAKGLDRLETFTTGYVQGSDDYSYEQGLGLYQGHKLGQQASTTYKKSLLAFLMLDVENLLAKQLMRNPNDEHLYESLKFYLMLFNPSKMEKETFLIWVDILLQREITDKSTDIIRNTIIKHLETAIDEQISPPPVNDKLVAAARKKLIETPIDLRLYRRLKNDYLKTQPGEFNISAVLGKKTDLIFYRESGRSLSEGIPNLFTYNGFHSAYNVQNKQLAQRLTSEQWIYGDEVATEFSEDEIKAITEKVDSYYFDEYIHHWHDLIADLRIKPFRSVNQGEAVLRLLAGTDKPLLKVIQSIRKNTALNEIPKISDEKKEAVSQLADNFASAEKNRLKRLVPLTELGPDVEVPGGEVAEEFEQFNQYAVLQEGLPLSQLQHAIEKLNRYFLTLADSSNIREAAFTASVNDDANTDPINAVKRSLREAHPAVQDWFNKVVSNANVVTAAATKGHVNNAWQSEVFSFYEKAIKGRYPVDPESNQDIKLNDFTAFFGPTGILQNYFNKNLKPFVDQSQSTWTWKKYIGISKKQLKLFQQADLISKTYFGKSKSEPAVTFTLKPMSLDKMAASVVLKMGGQTLTYNHGPLKAQKLSWPSDTTEQSKISFPMINRGTPITARTDGEWSWFRLLDQYAEVGPAEKPDNLILSFSVKEVSSDFLLTPQSTFNPFTQNVIKNFSIPNSL